MAHDPDPARAADTRLDINAALRILPPPQRAALVMVDMLGFSVDDAAAILATSPARSRAAAPGAAPGCSPTWRTCEGAEARGDRGFAGGRPRGWRRKGTDLRARASHLRREETHEEPAGRRNEQMTHPDPEVLAEFRAGLITGRRGARISAHLAACASLHRLVRRAGRDLRAARRRSRARHAGHRDSAARERTGR